MKTLWAGVAVLGLLINSAFAETRYDRKIDQAAMDIVAAKIGEIRGGFAYDAKPVIESDKPTVETDPMPTHSITVQLDPWKDGIAPAVERRVSRIVFF